MSKKLNTEQLIRTRLEDAELTPSPGTWKGILRKLRWKQFLRFNPGRFNIYYTGAILLTGAGLTILLWGDETDHAPVDTQIETITTSPAKETAGQPATEILPAKREKTRSKTLQHPETPVTTTEEPAQEPATESTPPLPATDPNEPAEHVFITAEEIPMEIDAGEEHLPFTCFASSVQSGCAPLEVHFTNQSVNATSYHWTFGTGDESEQKEPVYLFKEPGRFTVTLTAKNHGGVATVSRRLIVVMPQPVADFQVEEGFEGTDNHVVLNLVNYSSAATSFSWCLTDDQGINCSQWSSMEFQPSIKLNRITPDSRSVQLEVISEHGCRDTVMVDLPLKVESSEVKIKFATAFSPNPSGPGDGSFTPQSKRIDLFHPVYVEVPVEYRMRVFNRRGEMVFETQEVYRGWDGYMHQEQAPGDVYVWMVEGKWADGQPFSYHGDVTLVSNKYW